jgi:hypothetical protein
MLDHEIDAFECNLFHNKCLVVSKLIDKCTNIIVINFKHTTFISIESS